MQCKHFLGESLRALSTNLSHDVEEQIMEATLLAHFKALFTSGADQLCLS